MLNQIDLSRIDLNLFILFEAVLEQRHVGRAAKRLNLTPSAVSHGLGRMRRLLNDPLFLRTPKGVVPTGRALELADPIAEVLARARSVVATASPFDPKTSTRRFTIGAPDGVSAVTLPPLLADLRRRSPGIDISLRQILPPRSLTPSLAGQIWESAVMEIDAHTIDIAVVPGAAVPPRFVARTLYEETFVLAVRRGHPYLKKPTLDAFCRMQHLVVSLSGDPYGFIDDALTRQGRTRRVSLTVPNFMMALSVVSQTDLMAALPKAFVKFHAARFGVAMAKVPMSLDRSPICAVASKAALMDAGVAWLFDRLSDIRMP